VLSNHSKCWATRSVTFVAWGPRVGKRANFLGLHEAPACINDGCAVDRFQWTDPQPVPGHLAHCPQVSSTATLLATASISKGFIMLRLSGQSHTTHLGFTSYESKRAHDRLGTAKQRQSSSQRRQTLLHPASHLLRNDTVREISTCIEYGQPCLDRWSIHHEVNTVHEAANRIGDTWHGLFVTSSKHPHKFAGNRNRHGNKISCQHDLRGFSGLMGVVLNSSSDEHVCVGGDFHLAFAHSRAAIAFISSSVSFGPFFCERQPMKSEIVPFGTAALTTIRPSGNLSASIFSPGPTPRCSN